MGIRIVRLLAVLGAVMGLADGRTQELETAEPTAPNVVLLVMDTTAASHLSVYGYPRPTTPNLERIAAQGALYERAYSPAPWTLPSHASLFTGVYPAQHWATYEHPLLEESHTTLATVLQAAGYRTLGISNNGWVGPNTGLDRGFRTFMKVVLREFGFLLRIHKKTQDDSRPQKVMHPKEPPYDDAGARWTNELIRQAFERGSLPEPFFLFANYVEPHLPYHPPEGFAERFLTAGVTREEALQVPHDSYKVAAGIETLSDRDLRILRELYDAEIAYLDQQIGELYDFFAEQGVLERTIFVVVADHGEQLGEHGFLGHNLNVYDELLHVPLLVCHPGVIRAGTRIETPVSTLDVFASLLAWALSDSVGSQALPSQVLPVSSIAASPDRALISEYYRPVFRLERYREKMPEVDVSKFDRRLRALRLGPWKFISSSDGRHELYDTGSDQAESRDLYAERRQQAERLSAYLKSWAEEVQAASTTALESGELPEMDPETLEQLRELGYIK
jgi:arylsulfatase A-like enzyme